MLKLHFQMGFDGLFFGRIDYQDRIPRTAEKNLELLWEASANLGRSVVTVNICINIKQ